MRAVSEFGCGDAGNRERTRQCPSALAVSGMGSGPLNHAARSVCSGSPRVVSRSRNIRSAALGWLRTAPQALDVGVEAVLSEVASGPPLESPLTT